jgi:hypothetical protein
VAADPSTRRSAGMTRSESAREANDRLARAATRLRFVSRVPFVCECSNPDCAEFVFLRIEDYYSDRDSPLLAEEHRIA